MGESYRALFDLHAAPALIVEPASSRILDANEAAVSFYGWPRARLRRMRVRELAVKPPDELARELEQARARREARFSSVHRLSDGTVRDVAVLVSPLRIGRRTLLHAVIQDVTAQRRAEAELRESQERLSIFVKYAPAAIAMFDREMRYLGASQRWFADYRVAERDVVGRSHYEVFPEIPERWKEVHRRCLAGAVERGTQDPFPRADGTVDWVDWEIRPWTTDAGTIGGLVIFSEVITERVALQARLAMTSHLAALGTLVAGIAHEINNPLGGALASTGYAAEEIARLRGALRAAEPFDREGAARALDEVSEALEDAQLGDRRIAAIVKDLALYGRPDPERRPITLASVVEGALRWVPQGLRQSAEIQVVDEGAPLVVASPGQLGQVVVNLLSNAVKSVPADRRPVITVRLGASGPGAARLEVQDNGTGVPPEVADRMFDPFFTTRAPGKGMGLGLAIAQAIVSAHGGTITARSEPGRGATFRVELPAASPDVVAGR